MPLLIPHAPAGIANDGGTVRLRAAAPPGAASYFVYRSLVRGVITMRFSGRRALNRNALNYVLLFEYSSQVK
jgi:hypothetical protein